MKGVVYISVVAQGAQDVQRVNILARRISVRTSYVLALEAIRVLLTGLSDRRVFWYRGVSIYRVGFIS